ncbi:MAG: hypothetical protein IPG61_14610 [bacterium]|nr:hypothetical protein [bacterium]
MRAVLSLLVLVSCTVPAFAADVPPVDSQAPVPPTVALPGRGSALLQLSPMYVEVSDTLAVADAREKQLLADLAVATDDATAEAIVRELESLPLGRVLSILRIQARYARQENRPDLERQIKLRMLELQGAGRI